MRFYTIYDTDRDTTTGRHYKLADAIGQACVSAQVYGQRTVRVSMEPNRADVWSTGNDPQLMFAIEEYREFIIMGRPTKTRWVHVGEDQPNKLFFKTITPTPNGGWAAVYVDKATKPVQVNPLPPILEARDQCIEKGVTFGRNELAVGIATTWADTMLKPEDAPANAVGVMLIQSNDGVLTARVQRYV